MGVAAITVADAEYTLGVVGETLSVSVATGEAATLTVADEGVTVSLGGAGGAVVAPCESTSVTVTGGGEQVIEVGIEGPQGPKGETGDRGETGPAGEGLVGFEAENKDASPLVAGAPVAALVGGTGVRRATAATAGYECVGVAASATGVGFSALVLVGGTLTLADWSAVAGTASLTAGVPYYLSATAGILTALPPAVTGQRVQQVGVAVAQDTLAIEITPSILL